MSTSVPPPNTPGPLGSDLPPLVVGPRATFEIKARLFASAVALAAVVVAAFVAFGSTANKLLDPVALAATRSSEAPGYKVRMAMEIGTPDGAVSAVARGLVDSRDRAVSMSMAMTFPNSAQLVQRLGSDTLRLGMILSGGTMYMKLPAALTGQLSALGKEWVAFNYAKAFPSISALDSNPLSSDPSETLEYLRAISDSVVAEGGATVDRYATTHYRATLDLSKVVAALPSQDQSVAQQGLSQLEQQLGLTTIPVDVWVDSSHLVRRIQMSFSASGASGQMLSETMTEDMSDYGPQRPPAPPPASQVQSLSALPGLTS